MAQLHQILAIEKGLKSQEYAQLTELHKICQRHEAFSGLTKTYRKLNEDDEDLPPDRKKVQTTVPEVLAIMQASKADYLTMVARKEWGNCHAKADIVVDGTTIAAQVPVTYLLFLEKQFTDLRTFIEKLPTLDTSEDWTHDVNSGLYKTKPTETHRTKKVQKPLVLYEATKEHPAQAQLITEDVIAGYWQTVKESGAIPVPEWQKMMDRVDRLLRAIKVARETANSQEEVSVPPLAESLLGYVFPK